MPSAMILITSASDMGGHATGFWYEEVAAPYYVLKEAGYDVDLVSPQGGKPPVDQGSLKEDFMSDATRKFDADEAAQATLSATKPLASVEASAYDIVFAAGGHGTCVDFSTETVGKLLTDAYAAGKVVAAVCHGPTALEYAKAPDGKPLVEGKKVTGFTNEEESQVGLSDKVPYLLEDKLKSLGGDFGCVGAWQVHSVADGKLVTGQNPQSSEATAKKAVEAAA